VRRVACYVVLVSLTWAQLAEACCFFRARRCYRLSNNVVVVPAPQSQVYLDSGWWISGKKNTAVACDFIGPFASKQAADNAYKLYVDNPNWTMYLSPFYWSGGYTMYLSPFYWSGGYKSRPC
jgi:hypothetical protein